MADRETPACASCGRVVPPEALLPLGDAWVCRTCDARLDDLAPRILGFALSTAAAVLLSFVSLPRWLAVGVALIGLVAAIRLLVGAARARRTVDLIYAASMTLLIALTLVMPPA